MQYNNGIWYHNTKYFFLKNYVTCSAAHQYIYLTGIPGIRLQLKYQNLSLRYTVFFVFFFFSNIIGCRMYSPLIIICSIQQTFYIINVFYAGWWTRIKKKNYFCQRD